MGRAPGLHELRCCSLHIPKVGAGAQCEAMQSYLNGKDRSRSSAAVVVACSAADLASIPMNAERQSLRLLMAKAERMLHSNLSHHPLVTAGRHQLCQPRRPVESAG